MILFFHTPPHGGCQQQAASGSTEGKFMQQYDLSQLQAKKGFICDMDGVIYHGNRLLDGVHDFVSWLHKENKKYLFLTNSSEKTPRELRQKLKRMDLDVDESHFYTSALATAAFLKQQAPHARAYVIGDAGLINALYDADITIDDVSPHYVIIGETRNYNYDAILKAVKLVNKGAKLIATNSDMTAPSEDGIIPACRALVAPIELATGKTAYYLGKPNPLMMRTGISLLGCSSSDAAIVGDRMDTDIISGIESEIDTVLVLSGVSTMQTPDLFPYRPKYILGGVGDICR